MAREITKIALKAMAVTLLAILSVVLILFLFLSFTVPATMARLTKDLGMLKQSAWYSSLQYTYTGEIEDVEDALNCCILAKDYSGIVKYGSEFFADEEFDAYRTQREAAENGIYSEAYTQYIYGVVSIAYYAIGEGETGLSLALSVNIDTFEEYNAVKDLINEVGLSGDKDFATDILAKLIILRNSNSVRDTQYLEQTILNLTEYTS